MTATTTAATSNDETTNNLRTAIGAISRAQTQVVALLGGICWVIASPPRGWWPLTIVGIIALYWAMCEPTYKSRFTSAFAFCVAWLAGSLFWVTEFHTIGYLALTISSALMLALAIAVLPMKQKFGDVFAFSAVLGLAMFARQVFPFGGLPLGNPIYSLVNSPFASLAHVGGALLITATATASAVAIWHFVSLRNVTPLAVGAVLIIATTMAYLYSPQANGFLAVATVQGGGETGTRALYTQNRQAFSRQLEATETYLNGSHANLGLVVWPENVVNLTTALAGSPEDIQIHDLAAKYQTAILAGVVEPTSSTKFRNETVLWNKDGKIVASYEKEHRVPFGEYIPFRSSLKDYVDLDLVPKDAIPGHGINVVQIKNNVGNNPGTVKLGVLMSYEVFFPQRGHEALKHHANILIVPTNASSYKSSSVSAIELAAAQLQAKQFGRSVVQSAPTGISAVIDMQGKVVGKTQIGKASYIESAVELSKTKTIYSIVGDYPLLILFALVLLFVGYRRLRPKAVGKWIGEPTPDRSVTPAES